MPHLRQCISGFNITFIDVMHKVYHAENFFEIKMIDCLPNKCLPHFKNPDIGASFDRTGYRIFLCLTVVTPTQQNDNITVRNETVD